MLPPYLSRSGDAARRVGRCLSGMLSSRCATDACAGPAPPGRRERATASSSPAPKIGVAPPANAKDGEWTAARRATTRAADTASSHRSRRRNAKNLHVSWTFSTGVLRGHEGPAARRRQHDVHHHAISERGVRDRPHAAGLSAQVEIPPGERAGGGGRSVLRRRESRRVVRRRQDRLQPARRSHRRGRRRDGHRSCGARRWAISIAARRSRWRRSS